MISKQVKFFSNYNHLMKKRGLEGHYILFADQTGQDNLNLQEVSQNMNFSGLQELHNQLTKEIVPQRSKHVID